LSTDLPRQRATYQLSSPEEIHCSATFFAFDFFHSWLGFGRGGDTGRDDPAADLAASSRDLFFLPAVFKLLDSEGFILQVQ
jgi:hypothetical protein